jgi:polyisoprenoid-binding protein YceI
MKSSTPTFARKHPLATLLAAAAVALLAGCSDPADSVPKSQATAPAEPSGGAKEASNKANYVIRAESRIDFIGSKVTGKHDGGFKKFSGNVSVADGRIVTPAEIRIAMDSAWADNEKLTGHLKSPDFFDAAKYPVSTFTITSIEPEGGKFKVTGNLDLHGVAKSISFPADIQVTGEAVTLKADFAINRRDFNINYPGKPNDLIRDNVVLKLDVKATPGEPRPEDQIAVK